MVNSDSDFLGSINSDIFLANDFIKNEICRDILVSTKGRKVKRRNEDNEKFKRTKLLSSKEERDVRDWEENECLVFDKDEKRRNSTCLMFSSEMSDDGLQSIMRNSFDKKIEFLSISKKKSFNLFEESFFFSSENNLSLDKKPPGEKSPKGKEHNSDRVLKDKIHSTESNDRILKGKPFQSHWAFAQKKNLRNYSVPETRNLNEPVQRKHLIDFWKNVESEVQYSLPVLGTGSSDSLMRISVDTVSGLLNNDMDIKYSIIDCRFEYEFQGGHIRNAVNINTTNKMESFYKNKTTQVIIFHCEYSSIRAPRLANYLRNMDRNENIYPDLKFPEIYIMEGGYKKFYEIHQVLCTPMHYVSMDEATEKNTHF